MKGYKIHNPFNALKGKIFPTFLHKSLMQPLKRNIVLHDMFLH
jgi:hypothetical protein